MSATLEGTFRLIDRASRTLDAIERRAKTTDKALRGVGNALDMVERKMIGTASATRGLNTELEKLSRKRITPKIDLQGVAKAIAELKALQAAKSRVDGLLTANSKPGGPVGKAGRAFGGFGEQVGRAGRFVSGFVGALPKMILLLTAALPVVNALAGGVTALVSSLTAAVGGAGVIGGGFIGAFAVGIGSLVLGIKSAIGPLKEMQKAQEGLSKAVASGDPRKIREAQDQFNRLAKAAPGLAKLNTELTKTKEAFKDFGTPEGRGDFFAFATKGLRTMRGMMTRFEGDIERNNRAFYKSFDPLFKLLRGREFEDFFKRVSYTWQRSIGPLMKGIEGFARGSMRVITQGLPEVRRMARSFEDMGKNFASWAGSNKGERSVRRMIDSFRDWRGLLRSTVGLLRAVFAPARGAGDSMVVSLTATFDRWADWLDKHPAEVRKFFDDAVRDVSKFAAVIASLVEDLFKLGEALRPLASMAADLVGATGLSGTAGLLAGYATVKGAKAVLGGGGAGGAGGAAGGAAGGFLAGRARDAYRAARISAAGHTGGLSRIPAAAYGARAGAGVLTAGLGKMGLIGAGLASTIAAVQSPDGGGLGGRARNVGAALTSPLGLVGLPTFESTSAQKDRRRAEGAGQLETMLGGFRHGGARGAYGQMRSLRRLRKGQEPEIVTAINAEIQARKDLLPTIENEKQARSRNAGATAGSGIQEAFGIRSKKFGAERAFGALESDIFGEMGKRSKFSGKRQVAEAGLEAAREAARQNPKLAGEYEKLRKRVGRHFDGMGKDVILSGTRIRSAAAKDWPRIRSLITGPALRAKREASTAFLEIEKQALAVLENMGVSRSQAKRMLNSSKTSALPGANSGPAVMGPPKPGGAGLPGARPGGSTPTLSSPFGDGIGDAWGADAASSGVNPGGSKTKAAAASGGGNLMGANPGLKMYADMAAGYGLRVSSGLRPGSITNAGNRSHHASGSALDLAGSPASMMAFAQAVAASHGPSLEELIYSPLGWSIKNGQRVGAYAVADHYDHVHIADTAPSGAAAGALGAMPGAAGVAASLGRFTGVAQPGAVAAQAANLVAAGTEAKLASMMLNPFAGGRAPAGVNVGAGAGGAFNAQSLAALWTQAGGAPGMAAKMAAVAMAESSGNPAANGPPDGRGLWQIEWPVWGKTMSALGLTNAYDPMQNAMMAQHVLAKQGLSAWVVHNTGADRKFMGDGIGEKPKFGGWFGDGGSFTADRPMYIGVGERGKEHVQVTPAGKSAGGSIVVHSLIVHGGENTRREVYEAFADLARELNLQGPSE